MIAAVRAVTPLVDDPGEGLQIKVATKTTEDSGQIGHFDGDVEVRLALDSINAAIKRTRETPCHPGLRALLITARTGLEAAIKVL